MKLSIDEAPRDGRVCLIGGPCPSYVPEYRAWAWFDKNENAWCGVGSGGTFRYHDIEWYYPDPFGIQPATK